jgi:hypothetical protein
LETSLVSVKKYVQAEIHLRPLKRMSAIEPILTKITLAQRFLNNAYTVFHVNPTNSLIADNTSKTDGQTWYPYKASYLTRKGRQARRKSVFFLKNLFKYFLASNSLTTQLPVVKPRLVKKKTAFSFHVDRYWPFGIVSCASLIAGYLSEFS